jgi:hypothetical protein
MKRLHSHPAHRRDVAAVAVQFWPAVPSSSPSAGRAWVIGEKKDWDQLKIRN